MCMLCVIPPNTIPERSKLENSALNNPHGYGFAIVVPEENRIICERTMDADESINRFLKLRAEYQTGYAMWHARYATSGERTVDNCHPFLLPDTQYPNTTYVGHNGVLDVIEPKHEKRSDTRIFVEDLLPAIGGVKALDNDQVWNLLNEFTRGSKVCVLTVHPLAEYQMYLFHEDAGNTDEAGVWWSNKSCELSYGYSWQDSYKDYYTGSHTLSDSKTSKDSEYDYYNSFLCDTCDMLISFDEAIDDTCPTCHTCLMCLMTESSCVCYKPNKKKDKAVSKEEAQESKLIRSYHTPEGGWRVL